MKQIVPMEAFEKGLATLLADHDIYGPVRMPFRGTYSDTDKIQYGKVNSFAEMTWDEKSNFSPKSAVLPINQLLFYFVEDKWMEASETPKKIIVFLRACDLHGMKRMDEIYINNGAPDYFYKRRRDLVKFVVVGCQESYRNCFCVSMGSNIPEGYDAALNLRDGHVELEVIDDSLKVFEGEEASFEIDHMDKNLFSIEVPDEVDSQYLAEHEMWREFDTRCIACGRCNYVCPTCSCFDMQDIFYKENEDMGERRRVWGACMVDRYTDIAGGITFRAKYGSRMRFKAMHKIYDFRKRFGYNMCVGCGRCDDACPQYISFSSTIEKVGAVMKEKL